MKTYLTIALVGCFGLAALAFAQKPEGSNKLADLLPIGTCAIFHEGEPLITIEIVSKKAKSEDFDDESNAYYDKLIESGNSTDVEGLKRMKEAASRGLTSRVIYEVSELGVDHFVFKPREPEGNSWRALPFTSIRAINSPSSVDAK